MTKTLSPADSFLEDWRKGQWDWPFWCKRFFNVTPHPGQIAFANAILARDDTQWRAEYLTLFLSAGNRAGKTMALALVYLHAMFYKLGVLPSDGSQKDTERYYSTAYMVFHFGITQEVADLVHGEIVRLWAGTHVAQNPRGCPLRDEAGAGTIMTDAKYQGLYRWVRVAAAFGGAELHLRTTGEQGVTTLGREMNLIGFDECAFEPRLDFVVNQVLHMRRLGTGGQLLLVSTPTDGITQFADLWETGNPENPLRQTDRISLRMSTRDNIGYGLSKDIFDRLVTDLPDYLVPQNIDGYFIEGTTSFFNSRSVDAAFVDDLEELQPAQRGHMYVNGVDPALNYDSTWGIVVDITDHDNMFGVRAARAIGKQHTEAVLSLAIDAHRAYAMPPKQACITAIDGTALGGKVFVDLLRDWIEPVREVQFAGTRMKKLGMLGDLKLALDQGRLKFPRRGLWLQLRRQLLGYKVNDRKIEQDAVMALACAMSQVRHQGTGRMDSVPFAPFDPVLQAHPEVGVSIGFDPNRPWNTKSDLLGTGYDAFALPKDK